VKNYSCSFCLLLLVTMSVPAACAPGVGQQAEVLLLRDHRVMDDGQLQGYYRRLNDQLLRETRALRQTGLIGRQADENRVARIRERWNEVRAELRRREIVP